MTPLDQTFSALADPIRRAILVRLHHGEATVGELARPFAVSLPAISRHLKVLESAALISNRRSGKQRICALLPTALDDARDWLTFSERFWTGSLNRLSEHVRKSTSETKK